MDNKEFIERFLALPMSEFKTYTGKVAWAQSVLQKSNQPRTF